MATNIPPHNLDEIIDATIATLDQPDISLDDIVRIVRGPDFPTGGQINGREGIDSYLRTGRGIVRVRGKAHVEQLKNGYEQVVITEIPYNVNRASLVTRIADLVNDKLIDGIRDLRDESDENTRIVIELKRGEQASAIIGQLRAKTAFESSFGVILLALDKRRPKQMNIKELIECYIDHRRDVLTRRTQYRLREAEKRAHILEGYKIALDNLDDFVRIIRASANRDEAKTKLMERYPLSEIQTNAILDLRLYQLTGLEREKIEAEYLELMKLIEELRAILASDALLRALVKKELLDLKPKYSSPRRTEIVAAEGEFRIEDTITREGCIITVTHAGMIKRTPVAEYRAQKRGGKGIIGTDTYEEDFVEQLFTASTHDYILFVTSAGQCYAKKVFDIPEGARTAKGKSVSGFLRLREGEKIAAMVCFPEFVEDRYLVLATYGGVVKKTTLSEYENATREKEGGLAAINLRENDTVIGGVLSSGSDEIILVSHLGLAVRFQEGLLGTSDEPADGGEPAAPVTAPAGAEGEADAAEQRYGLRPQGRATGGVTGMKFKKSGDFVQAIEVCDPLARLLVAREDGVGKRTPFADYRLTRRGGTGVIAIDLPDDGSVAVAGALSVRDDDEIMLLTAKGQSVRTRVKEVRETGRGAKGVKLVDLADGDKLLAVARVVEVKDESSVDSAPAGETPPAPEA
jgi:DNA gyrase subunit A